MIRGLVYKLRLPLASPSLSRGCYKPLRRIVTARSVGPRHGMIGGPGKRVVSNTQLTNTIKPTCFCLRQSYSTTFQPSTTTLAEQCFAKRLQIRFRSRPTISNLKKVSSWSHKRLVGLFSPHEKGAARTTGHESCISALPRLPFLCVRNRSNQQLSIPSRPKC
jgi:hypothetical protein